MRTLLSISRPWFWLYLLGPFLVGFTAAAQTLTAYTNPLFWVFLLYFSFPANLFLYGVNDLYDSDTDANNEKKGSKEHRLKDDETPSLLIAIITTITIGLLLAITLPPIRATVALLIFLLLGYAYSAPPTRLKAIPVLDSASNILYVFPGFVGYFLITSTPPPVLVVVGVASWTMAMHLFSAIPDIDADREASLMTSAVLLGPTVSLIVCVALWSIFAAAMTAYDPNLFLSWLYPLAGLLPLFHGRVKDQYWLYPYGNALIGMMAFWYAAWPLL